MLKMIGVVMICFSSAMIGISVGNRIKTRCKVLSGFISAIDCMCAEITCLLTPIEEILEKLVAQQSEPTRKFFYGCLLAHKRRKESRFSDIWQEELTRAEDLCLKEGDIPLFAEIGNSFGRYTGEEQVRVLGGIREKLVQLQKSAQEESSRNVRLYRSLGITCGIALVILLI
ncbi:MAG: hypothetical protein E7471_00205 [Ruminococcaceae bacterium]|nr:hypothetical protein [Oscillospiraceae bacterium]